MYERVMGLNVIDEPRYQKYRERMTPILHSYGGAFGYDFIVAEVLQSKVTDKINRVFTIEFSSEETMQAFFADPKYIEVKERYLDSSIESKTVISMHEKT